MKAAFYERNETIRIGVCEPVAPAAGQVQIRVAYCGICGTDMHIFHGKMDKRVAASQIMGHELSGTVEAVGAGVTHVKPGDAVTVMPLDWCGECPACRAGHTHICQKLRFLGIDTQGAFQELWTAPARVVMPLPTGMSLRLGALIEPLAVACHDNRLGEVKAGEQVVVLGGGPIGALIGLVARQRGANVVVSEVNPGRIALLHNLGFETINPKEVDIAQAVEARTGGAGADVVFEVTAHPSGAATMTQLARTRGRIVIVGIFSQPPPVDLFRCFWRELRLIGARVYEAQDFQRAIDLIAAGTLQLEPLVTKVLDLPDLSAGMHLLEQGGDVMKVLIQCNPEIK